MTDLGLGAAPYSYGPFADGYRFGSVPSAQAAMESPGIGMGGWLSIFGGLNSAIGSFYSAKSQQYQAKSAAMNADFQQSMANRNARAAEQQAQNIMEAGQREAARYTMQAGAAKSSAMASQAARGIQAGVGSAAELAASADIIKQSDLMTIDVNTAREAAAARMQKVNYQSQAAAAGASAANMRATGRSINPLMGAGTTLLGGAASFASQYAQDRRWDAWARSQGTN